MQCLDQIQVPYGSTWDAVCWDVVISFEHAQYVVCTLLRVVCAWFVSLFFPIQDQDFIVELVFSFSYQNLEMVMKLLLYANNKVCLVCVFVCVGGAAYCTKHTNDWPPTFPVLYLAVEGSWLAVEGIYSLIIHNNVSCNLCSGHFSSEQTHYLPDDS